MGTGSPGSHSSTLGAIRRIGFKDRGPWQSHGDAVAKLMGEWSWPELPEGRLSRSCGVGTGLESLRLALITVFHVFNLKLCSKDVPVPLCC